MLAVCSGVLGSSACALIEKMLQVGFDSCSRYGNRGLTKQAYNK